VISAPAAPSTAGLLQYLALFTGLGTEAGRAVAELQGDRTEGSRGHRERARYDTLAERTCIDGGSEWMFSLLAPGERALRVLSRTEPPSGGVSRWIRVHYEAGGQVHRSRAESYVGEPVAAWEHAWAASRSVGGEDRLQRYHAVLGPRSRIYSVGWSLDAPAPEATVSWQLDRGSVPAEALAGLGLARAWPVAADLLRALLGYPVTTRTGPWSILRPVHEDSPRVRIGTTRWARSLEEPVKRRRFSSVVESLGGDRRFAEGLYKLIESASPGRGGRSIGRAVEVEVLGDALVGVEFYLCLPPSVRDRGTTIGLKSEG
jgi:hypothetical protein